MRRFGVTVLDNLQPRWNVAPSQKALVVTRTGLQPEGAMVAWGHPPGLVEHVLAGIRRKFVQQEHTGDGLNRFISQGK